MALGHERDPAVRLRMENWEDRYLSHRAVRSGASRGRAVPEDGCPVRTAFQRDRDRIVHSKAFRRLKHKTQVFIAPGGDHYRTRLTHTLEVAQVARTIARAMGLNEDLAEAIALGHDLGHTPFGHLGEDVLDEKLQALVRAGAWVPAGTAGAAGGASGAAGRFRHASQSLRVVDVLEGPGGLNLTWEVRDGIREHSSEGCPGTLEGQLVQLADRIAYLNHDIDDAVRAGILDPGSIPADVVGVLGERHSQRINTMVVDVIRNGARSEAVAFSPDVATAADELERFMFERVYLGHGTVKERERAARLLGLLFDFYMEHPAELREPYGGALSPVAELPRATADYVAGMTDRYAIDQFERHFIPSSVGVREDG